MFYFTQQQVGTYSTNTLSLLQLAIQSWVQSYCPLSYAYIFEQQGWSRCSFSDVVAQLKSLQPAMRSMFSEIETLVKLLYE